MPVLYAIARINCAEVLHNLGRDAEAHGLLDAVVTTASCNPLAHNGLNCLRAWILIHEARLDEARAILARLEAEALAPAYSAEVEYTWAALEREQGALEKALQHAEEGLACSVRVSSVRNGFFMLGTIAARRGDTIQAVKWFEQGMAHPYKGQARYGLLQFADLLTSQGDYHRAAEVRQTISIQDPESKLRSPLERSTANPEM